MAQYSTPNTTPASGTCNAANEIAIDAQAKLRDFVCNRVRLQFSVPIPGPGESAPVAGAKRVSFAWLYDHARPFVAPGAPRLTRPVLTISGKHAEFRPPLSPSQNNHIYYSNNGVDSHGNPVWKVIEVPTPLSDFRDTVVHFVPNTIRIHGEGAAGAVAFDPGRPGDAVDIWVEVRPKAGAPSGPLQLTAVIEYSLALEPSRLETASVSFP